MGRSRQQYRFRWTDQGWVGTDYDQLWITSRRALFKQTATLDDWPNSSFFQPRRHDLLFDLHVGLRAI